MHDQDRRELAKALRAIHGALDALRQGGVSAVDIDRQLAELQAAATVLANGPIRDIPRTRV